MDTVTISDLSTAPGDLFPEEPVSVEVEVEVEGATEGSYSWNAASDVDYHGEAAGIEDTGAVTLVFADGTRWPASVAQRAWAIAWCEARSEQIAEDLLGSYDSADCDF